MDNIMTTERNIQILIALLKEHNIKKVIASPGTTNMAFVWSMQNDPWFEIYSAVDERSAAYMAVGLSEEAGEPVVITCTEATASRNYMSGLTEAYYRKLPILVLTGAHDRALTGNLVPQVIDRSVTPKDIVVLSVELQSVKDATDEWNCEVKANQAILALKRHGGGPVHINLVTTYSRNYTSKNIARVRKIERIMPGNQYPTIPHGKRIGIFISSHHKFTPSLTNKIEKFCKLYNGVVFCDHTSNYLGGYKVNFSLVASQDKIDRSVFQADILIRIGEVSGADCFIPSKETWRVSEDGELRDRDWKLRYVFEMEEECFFGHYISLENGESETQMEYFNYCAKRYSEVFSQIPQLPFSNIWIAKESSKSLPSDAVIHFGILNSLRSWNFFELPEGVYSNSNVGGFGIDGGMSALIGASLANPQKIYFGVFGDLAFFYDLNSLGNRHVNSNIRILLINNGKGAEFRNYSHPAAAFGEKADQFIAPIIVYFVSIVFVSVMCIIIKKIKQAV